MNTSELDQLVNQTFSEIKRLLVVKGGEYANAEDRLANFKRGAALTGCTPLQVLFIYMSKHYDAVASFVQTSAKGEARLSSEPIEGRLDDLINYCLLAKGLIRELGTQDNMPTTKKEASENIWNRIIPTGEFKGMTFGEAYQATKPKTNPYAGVEESRNIIKGFGPEYS